MHLITGLENYLAPLLIIAMIFTDYFRKFNTDVFQRFIFLQILAYAMGSIACRLIYGYMAENPAGETAFIILLLSVLNILYYVIQKVSFFYIAVLVDYKINKEISRSKRLIAITWIMAGILLLLLVFRRNDLRIINVIYAYIPALVIIIDITLSFRSFIRQHLRLLWVFWGAITVGFLLDRFFVTSGLLWPCYSTALLYAYLLIIRTDSKLDALTGIGNRYAFNDFIEELSRKAAREKDTGELGYSIAMIDIDNFKKINDQLGHAEGDNALRDMAAIIKRCIRHYDFTARYGGDEFIIAVTAGYDIRKVLERIQESMNLQNSKKLRPYKLQMSYGSDVYKPEKHESMDEFLSHVDSLMYKQKEEHRRHYTEGAE